MRTALVDRDARRPALRLHAAGGDAARTIWNWSPRSRPPPRRCRCRCISKATRRRTTRASSCIKVTPDPGVIEVNIQPAAQLARGGRHTTASTRTRARLPARHREVHARRPPHRHRRRQPRRARRRDAADSPFLRRPDLLASLVLYWHNHPALSYLFSGMFIGPTSQAPRVDEARHDALYELEIALAHVPPPGGPSAPPWLVDRLLRNLLIDVTGNTHRAEFCIDKLYSPDGPTGRLGLLEMRAFEMPPHARMSLAQQLLLRALVARFWREPQHGQLRALGHRAARPLHAAALRLGGFPRRARPTSGRPATPSTPDWFAPHFEFRFPRSAGSSMAASTLELRQALEPWHVMGEEGAAGGTVRYVDSSVERLQVKVDRLRRRPPCRHLQRPRAAAAADRPARRGRRRRALQGLAAAVGLHPTIRVHAPLAFDIDRHLERPLARRLRLPRRPPRRAQLRDLPGQRLRGRGRRLARFQDHGHTPGKIDPPREERTIEFPLTLDLRTPLLH